MAKIGCPENSAFRKSEQLKFGPWNDHDVFELKVSAYEERYSPALGRSLNVNRVSRRSLPMKSVSSRSAPSKFAVRSDAFEISLIYEKVADPGFSDAPDECLFRPVGTECF